MQDIRDLHPSSPEEQDRGLDPEEFEIAISRYGNMLESTELRRMHQTYSRASTRVPSSPSTPSTVTQKVRYALRKFWRNQVSIVVAHKNCRDHLGESSCFERR